jgi:hypothetical protein
MKKAKMASYRQNHKICSGFLASQELKTKKNHTKILQKKIIFNENRSPFLTYSTLESGNT